MACIEEKCINFQWKNLRERDYMEDPGIGEKILKWALKEWGSWAWTKIHMA